MHTPIKAVVRNIVPTSQVLDIPHSSYGNAIIYRVVSGEMTELAIISGPVGSGDK